MHERESPRSHADFLCSRTEPDARARIYAALAERVRALKTCLSSRSSVRVRAQTLSCALAHLSVLLLDINYFHTWIKRQTLSTNQIFLRLTR